VSSRAEHRATLERQIAELDAGIERLAAAGDTDRAGGASVVAAALRAELAAHDAVDVALAAFEGA